MYVGEQPDGPAGPGVGRCRCRSLVYPARPHGQAWVGIGSRGVRHRQRWPPGWSATTCWVRTRIGADRGGHCPPWTCPGPPPGHSKINQLCDRRRTNPPLVRRGFPSVRRLQPRPSPRVRAHRRPRPERCGRGDVHPRHRSLCSSAAADQATRCAWTVGKRRWRWHRVTGWPSGW